MRAANDRTSGTQQPNGVGDRRACLSLRSIIRIGLLRRGEIHRWACGATNRSVMRSFRCPGGTLTITFTSTPPGVKQRSDWKVVKGLADFQVISGVGRDHG